MPGILTDKIRTTLEWDSILAELAKRCATDPGKEALAAIAPLPRDKITVQLGKITQVKDLLQQGERVDFSGIAGISRQLDLARREGMLKIEEIAAVRSFIIASRRVRAFLHQFRESLPLLQHELSELDPLKDIGDAIIPAITDDGDLNQSRFPALKRIKNEIYTTRQDIEKKLSSMIHSPHMEKYIQDRVFTTRNERYVLLVKSNMQQHVQGSALDVSASGATIFIEPVEVAMLNNRLIARNLELQIEINRILRELSVKIGAHADVLKRNLDLIAYLDFINAAAKFSAAIKGAAPEIYPEPIMRLYSARHPLLYLMKGDAVVPNDIFLGEDYTCLIISGANTGGKTVLLKTIGLCALLAIHGLHIPAGPDSVIGIFSEVCADIGDDQSIMQSLSSFSGQIVALKEMADRAGKSALLLIDEIVVGTNPRQGAALAQAILEKIAATGARIVVTTHYNELKDLAGGDTRFQNASVSFDLDTLSPTYRLKIGLPGVSYALEIARLYGISADILDRAGQLLDEREISTDALIEKIQRYEQEMLEERDKIEKLRNELRVEKEHYIEKQKRQERLIEEIKKEKGLLFLEDLKNYRRQIADRIKELQRSDIREAGKLQHEIKSIQDAIAQRMKDDSLKRYAHSYLPFDPALAKRGGKAFIISLEKEGVIESIDAQSESVELLLGSTIKSRFKFSDLLLLPDTAGRRDAGKKRKAAAAKTSPDTAAPERAPLTVQTSYNTIDLRGLRVEEALAKMEGDFDRMARGGIHTAVVIHGHGTGAVKEAVRANLKFSPYAANYRSGDYGEGGDGVTIVQLRD